METPRTRAAIEYVIDADLRFLSHHDEMRMLMRTIVRSGWPLAYSQGFNPQPRLSLPLPRRVGTASLSQWAIVDLDVKPPQAAPNAGVLFDSLRRAAPPNVAITGVTAPLGLGTPHPLDAWYEITLSPDDAAATSPRITTTLERTAIVVQRSTGPGKPLREIDVRPLLTELVLDGNVLRIRLAFEGQRAARPAEILKSLDLPLAVYEHRVRQVRITWDMELAGPHRRPAAPERNSLGSEEDHSCGRQAAHA